MTGPRICFSTLGYPPAPGGVAQSAARVVGYFVEAGFDVHVFTVKFGEPLGKSIPTERGVHGVPVTTIPWDLKAETTANILAFYSAIQDADSLRPFDLFHGYFLPFAYPCILVAGGKRPVVASIRGDDAVTGLCSPEFFPFINVVMQRASWITSVSSDLLKAVSGLASTEDRSSVIPNSIKDAGLPPWQLTDLNRGIVGTIGTRPKKAVPLLIEAYANVSPSLRRRLHVVGPHPGETEQSRVEEAIQRFNMEKDVYLLGAFAHDELPAQLQGMHVYVQCSDHEGLPNAVLEAAAIGVPLIGTSVGGLIDVLKHGENALVVPRRDAEALTSAITEVLSDDALARKLSQGARELARSLSPASERDAWLGIYRRHL
jgi:glycosyltransferase involved in cell wall biosynthesis